MSTRSSERDWDDPHRHKRKKEAKIIVIDSREPEELETFVRTFGVECDRTVELEYGDAAFMGSGPDGECGVGFERKRLGDLLTSMRDRRLAGYQIRGMVKSYDFRYLVSEGIYKEGSGGEIVELRGKEFRPVFERGNGRHAVSYEQLDHFLCTLELKAGVILKRTRDARETARFYVSRWRWFNLKRWEDHHSHDQLYLGLPAKGHGTAWGARHSHDEEYEQPGRGRVALTQENPTTCWRMAACLPGIDRKAETVARHFGTVRRMAAAGEEEWMGIDFGMNREGTKRNPGIGEVTARAVIRAITEEGA